MKWLKTLMILAVGVTVGVVVAMRLPNPFARSHADDDFVEGKTEEASPLQRAVSANPRKPSEKRGPAPPAPPELSQPKRTTVEVAPELAPQPAAVKPGPVARGGETKDQKDKDSSVLSPELRERLTAATVLLRIKQATRQLDCCGVICKPNLLAVNAQAAGIAIGARELPNDFSVTLFTGAAGDPGRLARVRSFDADAHIIFFSAPGMAVPLPLADDSALHPQMAVWYPRYVLKGADVQPPVLQTGEILNVRMDPQSAKLTFVAIAADIDGGSAGAPLVDSQCRLVALAGANSDDTSIGRTVNCADLRRAMKGRIGALLIRKTAEKPGGLYSVEVRVDSVDPADRISAVNFYYWPVRTDAEGNASGGSMQHSAMFRNEGTAQWSAQVNDILMPPGSKLFMQTGYYGAEREEILSEPLNCAIQLGVPNAPPAVVVAARSGSGHGERNGTNLNASRVEAVEPGGPTQSFFVGTQTTSYTETTYIITSSGQFTRIETVVTLPPPGPPPDSPGWTFGYRTDHSTGHPSGDYENAERDRNIRNYSNGYFNNGYNNGYYNGYNNNYNSANGRFYNGNNNLNFNNYRR